MDIDFVIENINHNLLKVISNIAKKENTTEVKVINRLLEKGIEEMEILEEKLKYPDGIPISVVAEEFGQTEEELRKELDDSIAEIKAGKGIKMNMEELAELLGVDPP